MRWFCGAVLLVGALAVSFKASGSPVAPAQQVAAAPGPTATLPFRLLSYNVHGTPWPLSSGRTQDLRAIAADLRTKRGSGDQPHIVVLQEAFVGEAKAIGREAGYHYVAFGPRADAGSTVQSTAADRQFASHASFWSGERMGKRVDSGLALFSDYPILWVKRVVFPGFACAGWDCLANKGALAAAVQVPGIAEPLVIVTTHLNARGAAGVGFDRSNYAFQRQLDELNHFMSTLDGPLLLAGDFNIGTDPVREASFSRLIADRGLSIVAVERRCGHGCHRAVGVGEEQAALLAAAKSMVLSRSGGPLMPSALATFGRTPKGAMMSDHIGLDVGFGLAAVLGGRS